MKASSIRSTMEDVNEGDESMMVEPPRTGLDA